MLILLQTDWGSIIEQPAVLYSNSFSIDWKLQNDKPAALNCDQSLAIICS